LICSEIFLTNAGDCDYPRNAQEEHHTKNVEHVPHQAALEPAKFVSDWLFFDRFMAFFLLLIPFI
jgi:hypothetical protein